MTVQRTLMRRDVARALGVSAAAVGAWDKKGLPRTMVGRSPRYNLEEVQAWRVERGLLSESEPVKSAPGALPVNITGRLEAAKMRIAEAKAEQEELALKVQRGDLVNRDQVIKGWLQRIVLVRSRVMAVGARRHRQWAALTDPRKLLVAIDKEMRAILEEFAQGLSEAKSELDKPKAPEKRKPGRPKGSKTKVRKGVGRRKKK